MTDALESGDAVRRWPAPAKINLALHVTGRRADGYHEIESFAVFTRFGDLVSVTESDTDSFTVDGPFATGVPLDGDNLVIRARDALRRHVSGEASSSLPLTAPLKGEGDSETMTLPSPLRRGVRRGGMVSAKAEDLPPVAIRLTKNLPIASGVGGGSSDAAAALRALNRLWDAGLSQTQLAELGKTIGADVPMCLHARPLLASGIGERIEPVADVPALALVLVNPGVAVSTAQIFSALERRDNESMPALPRVIEFHSLRNWLETTRNDLEPAARALQPVIGSVLAALHKANAGFARMSGSGATCFGLFETGNVAKRAAIEIRRRHPDWFVAATRSISSEAGPHGHD